MEKIWLIIKREYSTRVMKKSFFLWTIFTPLLIAGFSVLIGFLMSYNADEQRHIAIRDEGNLLKQKIEDSQSTHYEFSSLPLDTLKSRTQKGTYDGVLVIPAITDATVKTYTIKYYSDSQLGINATEALEDNITEGIKSYKINSLQIDTAKIAQLKTSVNIDPDPISADGKNESEKSAAISLMVGILLGIVMYLAIIIYGQLVMRAVTEEKTNRIIEVMASSVKPIQLMIGKIIGVGAVGLTQFFIWGVLTFIFQTVLIAAFGIKTQNVGQLQQMQAQMATQSESAQKMAEIFTEIGNINWLLILPLGIFYFLCGYFLYASMFAAVGSAVSEDAAEAQSLTIPISMPAILGFYFMFSAIRAPESGFAIFGSIFPFFAPFVMPALSVYNPPWWQILASMLVMLGTTLFFMWLSARIYRVGILMYGKKASFKELSKWVFYRD